MNFGYIRVSTDRQSLDSQKNVISRYCIDHKITIDEWFELETGVTDFCIKVLSEFA